MKLSVIVPVYNSEKYLENCILSVINQTYENWELILVDDGSVDNSLSIIDKYASKDNRFISIHQSNTGPGIARNNGIQIATGDYIIFLDSDDYIDKDYFSLLVPKAEKADIVFIDIIQVSSKGKIMRKEYMSKCKMLSKEKILRLQLTGMLPWGGVRKAVRRSLLIENDIKYTNHKIGEEALYSFKVLYNAKTIDFLDKKPVYYYVNHEGSQSKILLDDPWGDVTKTMLSYLKENGLYEEYSNTLNSFMITALVISIDRINNKYKGKNKQQLIKKRMHEFNDLYDKKTNIDLENMTIKAKIFIPFIKKGITWPIVLLSTIKRGI